MSTRNVREKEKLFDGRCRSRGVDDFQSLRNMVLIEDLTFVKSSMRTMFLRLWVDKEGPPSELISDVYILPTPRRPRAAQATTIAPRWQTVWRQHGPFGGTLARIFGPRIWRGRRTPVSAHAWTICVLWIRTSRRLLRAVTHKLLASQVSRAHDGKGTQGSRGSDRRNDNASSDNRQTVRAKAGARAGSLLSDSWRTVISIRSQGMIRVSAKTLQSWGLIVGSLLQRLEMYTSQGGNRDLGVAEAPEGEGSSGYTLCIRDVPLSRVRFSRFLSGKGVVFRPNSLARGVFWSWFDTEILTRVVILSFFFSGKGGKFLSGKGKGMPPWAAHPYP